MDALEFLGSHILCGCGTGAQHRVTKQILDKCKARVWLYDSKDEDVAALQEFAAKVLDDWGLMEHGGNVGASWLTPLGESVLAFYEQYGTDEDEWPDDPVGNALGMMPKAARDR